MKLLTKILLAFGVVILGIIIIIGITIYQGIQIISIANDKTFQQDIESLMNGDCSKLPNVESKLIEIQKKVSAGCKNPIIKIIIKEKAPPKMQNVCIEINNRDNQINKQFAEIKQYCLTNKTS